MNTRKIFMAAGAFTLAVGSFFAGKAAVKRTQTALYFQDGTTCKQIAALGVFTTSGTSGNGITFYTTTAASPVQVYTNVSGSTCVNAISSTRKIRLVK